VNAAINLRLAQKAEELRYYQLLKKDSAPLGYLFRQSPNFLLLLLPPITGIYM
jgi:hypothetical protein